MEPTIYYNVAFSSLMICFLNYVDCNWRMDLLELRWIFVHVSLQITSILCPRSNCEILPFKSINIFKTWDVAIFNSWLKTLFKREGYHSITRNNSYARWAESGEENLRVEVLILNHVASITMGYFKKNSKACD